MKNILSLIRKHVWVYLIPLCFYLSNFFHTRIELWYRLSKINNMVPSSLNMKEHVVQLKSFGSYIRILLEVFMNLDYLFTAVFVGAVLVIGSLLFFVSYPFILKKIRNSLSDEVKIYLRFIDRVLTTILCLCVPCLILFILNHFMFKQQNIVLYLRFLLNPLFGILLMLVLSFIEACFILALYNVIKEKSFQFKSILSEAIVAMRGLWVFNLCIMFLGYIPPALQFILQEIMTTGANVERLYLLFLNVSKIVGFGLPILKVIFFFFPIVVVLEKKQFISGIVRTLDFMYQQIFQVIPFFLLCVGILYLPIAMEWVVGGFVNRFTLQAQLFFLGIGMIYVICCVLIGVLGVRFYVRYAETK